MGPFDLINIIYANIKNPLCNFIAPALMSFIPSFVKIRLNLAEERQCKWKMTDGSPVSYRINEEQG